MDSYERKNDIKDRERDNLDRHGIDLTGGLRRSKKKSKKLQKEKLKGNERNQKPVEIQDERARLARMLDNSNEDSQVEIITTLVNSYGPTANCQFEVVPGEKVIARYRRGDFINVHRSAGESGFVPVRICFLVAEKTPTTWKDDHGSTPSIKSTSPICNGALESNANEEASNASLQTLSKTPLDGKVANETEVKADTNTAMMEDGKIENKPKSSLEEVNDFECDSLARKVKRHEIRQLLKRETSLKMLSSSNDIQELTNDLKPNQEVPGEVDDAACDVMNDENAGLQIPNGNDSIASLLQTPSLQSSNLSLNARIKNGVENKTSSKLSLDSILKETRGSQQSLSSLKSKKYPVAATNVSLQNKGSSIGLNPRYFSELQQARFDTHSLSSYEGSLQEIHSRLNGDFHCNPPKPGDGFFYPLSNSPKFNEQRILDLQNESPFHGNRRCSSLRRGPNYTWFPQSYLNGYGHGRFVDGERAWKYFAESMSTPGSRVVSPSMYENPRLIDESSKLVDETTMFALRDFQAVEKDEVSMRKGERVSLLRKESEDWWLVINNRGERGLVPSYFLIPLLQPSQYDMGMLNGSPYGFLSTQLLETLRNQPYRFMETERRVQDQDVRSGMEHERKGYGKSNGLTRSNTIGSDSRINKGSRIDWRKVYNNENGPRGLSRLKNLSIDREKIDDIQSKEELLNRIRNEVMKDPVKEYSRKKSLSNENMHKISMINEGTERPYQGPVRGRDLMDKGLIMNNRETMPKYSENITIPDRQHNSKIELPSYDECIEQISRDQRSDAAYTKELSTSNSELFDTPRILRRRMTYTGGSTRKVKCNAADRDDEEKLTDEVAPKLESNSSDSISTWC